MDDFEKYIKENKLLFDEHEADQDKIWQGIESELEITKEKKSRGFIQLKSPFLKIAAGICILIGSFSILTFFTQSSMGTPEQNSAIHQELKDIDNYYKGLVSFQVALVKKHSKLSSRDKEEFLSFMDELDKEYIVLKKEMTANLNNEYILEAIVQNYKKRIELIENLLDQIKDSKKSVDNEGYIL
ncbi:hypothetical protein [Aquimarina litoralis]|uniref:hypothetical protein n=1 Tax=Aquimarina litoralis TaxID=584605 RepID=UPI001C56E5CE|nr:hypothetical protein [Aquimarina litoralis]MBW1298176.1 hypothetical protein [Aquimarina litoralis]